MATKKTKLEILGAINASIAALSKERDTLRDVTEDAKEILDNCDEAILQLKSAADLLSQNL